MFPRSIASCQGSRSFNWTDSLSWFADHAGRRAYLNLGLPDFLIFDVFDARSQVVQNCNFDRRVLPLHDDI